MILVKYCEEEFNIEKGCNTLQLGTFQYYREKDPSFSIADPEEGYVQISTDHKTLVEVPYSQWNRLFGQVMFIDDNNNIKVGGNGGQRLPGNIKFDISNGKFDFDGDRKMLKFNSDIDFKFFYPNSYIFCISQEPYKNSIDPKRIDDSYDSYYIFSEQKLPILMQYISNALSNTVRLEDINSIDLIQKAPLAKLMSGLECRPIVSTVNYVAEKNLVVTNPDQFNQNSLFDLYFKGLFKKNDKYQGDNELRIVFPIRHVNFGFLSVKKTPIHLNLKPILECLDER